MPSFKLNLFAIVFAFSLPVLACQSALDALLGEAESTARRSLVNEPASCLDGFLNGASAGAGCPASVKQKLVGPITSIAQKAVGICASCGSAAKINKCLSSLNPSTVSARGLNGMRSTVQSIRFDKSVSPRSHTGAPRIETLRYEVPADSNHDGSNEETLTDI